jgi:hypothetical protein
MRLVKAFGITLIFFASSMAFAQTQSTAQTKKTSARQTTQSVISDEDLHKYAATMDSVKGMQETLIKIITENVQQNKVMTVQRYNELNKIADDQQKIAAANATSEEMDFVNEIADLKKYNTARINSAFQSLVKDYVGLKTFNSIKKGLDTDPNLKSRYEQISTSPSTSESASNREQH